MTRQQQVDEFIHQANGMASQLRDKAQTIMNNFQQTIGNGGLVAPEVAQALGVIADILLKTESKIKATTKGMQQFTQYRDGEYADITMMQD